MGELGWRFPALLIAAMLLAMVLTILQVRRYNRELQAALASSTGAADALVSGRSRSFSGGALVVLVVDTASREVVRARAMTGFSVFARFRDRPELLGPVSAAADRARGRALRRGVTDALLRVPKPPRARGTDSLPATSLHSSTR